MQLSIIVPVYKSEKYLSKCLDSLVNQSITDYEIICIHDGSPDHCLAILEDYASRYSFIKIVDQENKGIAETRNVGLSKVQGDYFTFVDSDDTVSLNMYEKMLAKIKSQHFDMVCCDIEYVHFDGSRQIVSCGVEDCFDKASVKKSMCFFYPALWNKVYDSKLLKLPVAFQTGVWYEDMDYLYRLFPYLEKIGVIHEPFNQYYQHTNAITHTFDHRLFDYIKNCRNIVSFYQEHHFFDEYYSELEYSCTRYLYATFLARVALIKDKTVFEKALIQSKDFLIQTFTKSIRNPYFKQAGFKGFYLRHFNKGFAYLVYYLKKGRG